MQQQQQSDRRATAIDHSQFVTDGGEEPETFAHVTLMEATNADTQMVLLGEEGPDIYEVAELHDGTAVYARRYYEPADTAELPDERDREATIDWLESNRDHELFDDYDWEEHDRRQYLEAIVNNRNSFRGFLSHIERELAEVRTVGVEATEKIDEIQEKIVDATMDGPAVSVNCVERPDDDSGEEVAA